MGERLARAVVPVPAVCVPVPERLTVCGLPLALSVMLSEAVRLPLAEGVNFTLIVQLAPAATELPHVLVCAKSLALVPVSARLVMFKAALPVLVSVTVWAVLVVLIVWFPKARLPGAMLATGAGGGSIPPVLPPQATCHAAARITDRAKTRDLVLGSFLLSAFAAWVFIMEHPLVGSSAESVGKKKRKSLVRAKGQACASCPNPLRESAR